MKRVLLIMIALFAVFSFFASAKASFDIEGITCKVEVLEAEGYFDAENNSCQGYTGQKLKIKVLSDNYLNGKEFNIDNAFENDYYRQAKTLNVGDKVDIILYIGEEGRVNFFYILNKNIYYHGIWLAILFLVLLIIIGRKKGIKSALSLVLTLLIVIFVMIPALKNGRNPVPATILSCLAVTVITMFIVGGFGSKSLSAILGTLGGLLTAWGLAAIVSKVGNMTAITTAEVEMLMYSDTDVIYNLRGILLSGIIIGCLGAIMDVAMSISSSIHQIREANNQLTSKDLFKSGMEVGCDIIGTMANTLVLAYTGSALTMILVQSTNNMSIIDLLNHDFIFVEILRTLAGSIGMVLTVPFTAVLASFFAKHKKFKESEE